MFPFDLRHYELPLWYLQTFLAAGRQTAINQSAIRNMVRGKTFEVTIST
jgi:hypothetical protein